MTDLRNQLRGALRSAGWEDCSDLEPTVLDFVLRGSYAALGMVVAVDAASATKLWIEAQTELAELRSLLGRQLDLYLLICVPEIEEEALDSVSEMINDTHVCRKLLVEVRGRSAEDALSDVPILFWPGSNESAEREWQNPLSEAHIPATLLDDLSRRGAGRILDKLLAGEYEGRSPDAD